MSRSNGFALVAAVALASGLTGCDGGPTSPDGGLTFAAVTAGYSHACGVTTAGPAYCWGSNEGALGDGTTTERLSPVLVAAPAGVSFAAVTAGYIHTCGVTAAGAAYCWGNNDSGQLGDGTMGDGTMTLQRLAPVLVAGGLSFAAVTAGSVHTCGLTAAGAAYCWGRNGEGQLGVGTTTGPELCAATQVNRLGCSTVPVPVAGGLSFAAVTAGDFHTCGVTAAGPAYCWGSNEGQLGDGTLTERPSPVSVAGGLSFAAVTPGGFHTCGVTAAGAAYCWGNNDSGQLGDGTLTDRSSPVPVAGGLSFAAVTAGGTHTCGVTAVGAAYCWGLGGTLGDGTTIERFTPVRVVGG